MLIILKANFGVIDDHTLINTLLQNKPIPFFIYVDSGRYYPLDAFDLNILNYFFGVNPYAFYAFSTFGALVLIICLFKSLNLVLDSKNISALLIILILTSPAFATAFLRLFVPEKFESVLFAIFIFFYILYKKDASLFSFFMSFICGSLALYYKEIAFIALGSFAFFNFIFTLKNANKKSKILDILLMLSALFWLLIYFVIVVLNKTSSTSYGDTPYNQYIVMIKNLFNYSLNDPFLFIGIFSLVFYRIYLVCIKKHKIHPLQDSALLASFLHSLAYLKLNMWAFHYPLPAYIFGVFAIGFYFREYFRVLFIRLVFFLCLALYILNQLPTFLHEFNHYKFVPINFNNTISFLDSYLKQNPKSNIHLYGVNRASNGEVYASFAKYLESRGNLEFDLRSNVDPDNFLLAIPQKDSKYSVFKSMENIDPKEGDLVVLSPYTSILVDYSMLESYELLYSSSIGFNMPLLNIKTLMKYFALKYSNNLVISKNLFYASTSFSVYKVK